MRLIDKDALLNAYNMDAIKQAESRYARGCLDVIGDIESAPTIEAEPVRYGHWVGRRLGSTDVICSKCSTLETIRDSNYKSRFCPNCGAKMDGDSR